MSSKLQEFKSNKKDVAIEYVDDRGLVALQGPLAAAVLQQHVPYDLSKQPFMTSRLTQVVGVDACRVTRCGYTGEDGFELSIPAARAEHIVEHLLGATDVQMAGLGARDTLRLEAGLCLYGNDIDETTTPIEAGLTWTIGKRRREQCNFPGAIKILQQIRDKPSKRRVGLRAAVGAENGPPPRTGYQVVQSSDVSDATGVGKVTSGCRSPSLQTNIAMAYVAAASAKVGTAVQVEVRGKRHAYIVSKMPFVPSKYFSG